MFEGRGGSLWAHRGGRGPGMGYVWALEGRLVGSGEALDGGCLCSSSICMCICDME